MELLNQIINAILDGSFVLLVVMLASHISYRMTSQRTEIEPTIETVTELEDELTIEPDLSVTEFVLPDLNTLDPWTCKTSLDTDPDIRSLTPIEPQIPLCLPPAFDRTRLLDLANRSGLQIHKKTSVKTLRKKLEVLV